GWVVLAASAVAGAMALSGNSKYEEDSDTYQALLDDYNRETNIEVALLKKAAVQKSFDVMKSSEQERNLYMGALGGLWLYNIIDITF
ncbi:MAG: hypothetical protein KAU50_09020, partial [Candidatus Marinimicrobia bacterium]|nr:hypothetical protein [Candidatus Neomarinimicrobiota bacterium]